MGKSTFELWTAAGFERYITIRFCVSVVFATPYYQTVRIDPGIILGLLNTSEVGKSTTTEALAFRGFPHLCFLPLCTYIHTHICMYVMIYMELSGEPLPPPLIGS